MNKTMAEIKFFINNKVVQIEYITNIETKMNFIKEMKILLADVKNVDEKDINFSTKIL